MTDEGLEGLIFRTYQKLLQIGKEKADHATEKSAKGYIRHHTKEDT